MFQLSAPTTSTSCLSPPQQHDDHMEALTVREMDVMASAREATIAANPPQPFTV